MSKQQFTNCECELRRDVIVEAKSGLDTNLAGAELDYNRR